jgi:elongation factor P
MTTCGGERVERAAVDTRRMSALEGACVDERAAIGSSNLGHICYDCKDIQAQTMASYLQATRLRKGNLIKVGNDLFRILELHHLTPGNKRAHIQVRMRNIRTGTLADEKFRAEEDVERATLDEREMQYLYNGDHFYFMDTATYDQIHISAEALGDSKDYLIAEMLIRVEFYDVEPVGIELPPTVDLLVKETVPGIKGATASAQVKPATLETGLVINVPAFVNEGDKVRVNTETGEYQSRV